MSRIHKLELYIVDTNDLYGETENLITLFDNYTDCMFKVVHSESKEFEWDDDLKINYTNAKVEDYEEYFK